VGCQHLHLYASNGHYPSTQGDLAGHAHIPPHKLVGEQTCNGCNHGNARRRPVLWDGTSRYVQVHLALFKKASINVKHFGFGTHIAVCNFRAFLHHITQLTCQCQYLFSWHAGGLDK